MAVALSPAEAVVARLHARIVELEEALVVDCLYQEKASDLATLEAAVESFAFWTAERQRDEALLAELRRALYGEEPEQADPVTAAKAFVEDPVRFANAQRFQSRTVIAPESELETAAGWGY